MNDTAPQVVRSYLSELDSALNGLPETVRQEILGGVREELDGLDGPAAAARIEDLGDPSFIAAEAKAEAGESAQPQPDVAPQWYPVVATLLVAFGGIVLPVVGWVAGVAMIVFSRLWFAWEKVFAVLVPIAASIVAIIVSHVLSGALAGSSVYILGIPSPAWLIGLVIVVVATAASGLWLLWRVRRTPRPRP